MSSANIKPTTLLFDLDDTLYPRESGLMKAVTSNIDKYIQNALNVPPAEATELRIKYRDMFGTSLVGLVKYHDVNVAEYADFVYDIDYPQYISKDEKLISLLTKLPQRKIIYTNASRRHPLGALEALGLASFFDMVVAVQDTLYYSKPQAQSFREMLLRTGAHPRDTWFFDDQERNLIAASKFGITTVMVAGVSPYADYSVNKVTDIDISLLI